MKELTFVSFHTPVFFAAKNWGNKIEPYHKSTIGKIKAFLENDTVMLQVGERQSRIPISNVVSYEFLAGEAPKVEAEIPRLKPGPKPKAQVGGPTHHVFDNGPGKARD